MADYQISVIEDEDQFEFYTVKNFSGPKDAIEWAKDMAPRIWYHGYRGLRLYRLGNNQPIVDVRIDQPHHAVRVTEVIELPES